MQEADFQKIESLIARQVGAFADSIQHKLDVVVEGHQMLSEKIDRVEARLDQRIDCVVRKLDAVAALAERTADKLDIVAALAERTAAKLDAVAAQGEATAAKLDAVAADLKAHRADTEAHPPVFTG